MIITEHKFYNEVLDLSVPELNNARNAFASGDRLAAAHIFADYVKRTLQPDTYFKIPYYPRENVWARDDETDLEVCERVLKGQFMSVGVPIDFGSIENVDWFANPTYNAYREWNLQLHRHHEWRALGKVYRDTGDERYAECFAKLIHSWITTAEQCPESLIGYGSSHWRTIECGIRMTKIWHYAIHAFLHSPAISDELWVLIFMSVWEHAYRLRGFNTAANWLIMELNGLLHIGIIYGFFKEATDWKNYSLERLEAELINQVYADSFQVELTTGYHNTVIANYAWVLDICKIYDVKLPDKLMERYHNMFYMPVKLTTPAGVTPCLNDGGALSVKKVSTRGIGMFPDDEVLKYFATDGKEGKTPDYTTAVLEYSGMVAFRTDWSADATYGFLDAGPFGEGHQHEDKLNFLLYAYGTNMLPDSGSFRYDKSKMREYVLGTRSHNTGLVDHQHQNRRAKYRYRCLDVNKKADFSVNIGENLEIAAGYYNEGYGPDFINALHRRKVVFFKKGLLGLKPFFLLIDSYSCDDKEHKFETSFQLPAVPISLEGKNIVAKYDTGASLVFASSTNPTVYCGRSYPYYIGWRPNHAPESTEHYPAPVISYKEQAVSTNIVTVLYPVAAGEECPVFDVRTSQDGFEIKVKGGESASFFYDCEELKTSRV